MSKASNVYIGMFVVLIAGLWGILRIGAGLHALPAAAVHAVAAAPMKM